MPPEPSSLAGRVDVHRVVSDALRGNPLGDPHERPLWVQVPPGYSDDPAPLPTVYVLPGYFGRLEAWDDRVPFRPTVPEAVDARFRRRDAERSGAGPDDTEVPPAIVVYVDAWTAYGGSQFVDSPGTGDYLTYVCDEVVPFVDARYRTRADPSHRAVTGHSSGGFGAMVLAMLRPDRFGALASHAGDALYEYLYLPLFARAVRLLRPWDGDIAAWWADMGTRTALTREGDEDLALLLGVSACFTPGPDGVPVLPFDPRTGVLDGDLWGRWLAWDPVRMAAGHAETLAALRAAWLDGGTSDEWHLDLGATAFAAALSEAGLPDDRLRLELFAGGHERVEYRFPDAIAWLAARLV